jgi:hypothetical protein
MLTVRGRLGLAVFSFQLPPSTFAMPRLPTLVTILALAAAAGCQQQADNAAPSPEPAEQTAPTPDATDTTTDGHAAEDGTTTDDPPTEGFELTRRLGIQHVDDIRTPDHPTPTTAALARRSTDGKRQTKWPGLVVQTTCRDNVCLDGLADGDTTVIEPTASDAPDEGWMERVVRIPWANSEYVSTYIATSRYTRGAAHTNNRLRCRTLRRRTGEPVTLEDILGETSANRLVAKANGLLDANRAIDILGRSLDASGYTFTAESFRFGRTPDHDRPHPEIILCAEGPYPRDSGHILEMRPQAMPVGYLLRPTTDE